MATSSTGDHMTFVPSYIHPGLKINIHPAIKPNPVVYAKPQRQSDGTLTSKVIK